MSPDERRDAILALEQEAKDAADEARDQIEEIRNANAIVSRDRAKAFIAARRARLWHMPTWVWVPLVVILVVTLLLPFFVSP